MRCPYEDCQHIMDLFDHGICPKCKRYCGCSFNPVSNNDFCSDHRPNGHKKYPRDLEKARKK